MFKKSICFTVCSWFYTNLAKSSYQQTNEILILRNGNPECPSIFKFIVRIRIIPCKYIIRNNNLMFLIQNILVIYSYR